MGTTGQALCVDCDSGKFANVSSVEVDLTEIFDNFINALPSVDKEEFLGKD